MENLVTLESSGHQPVSQVSGTNTKQKVVPAVTPFRLFVACPIQWGRELRMSLQHPGFVSQSCFAVVPPDSVQ